MQLERDLHRSYHSQDNRQLSWLLCQLGFARQEQRMSRDMKSGLIIELLVLRQLSAFHF